jgi:hypothetical protein
VLMHGFRSERDKVSRKLVKQLRNELRNLYFSSSADNSDKLGG